MEKVEEKIVSLEDLMGNFEKNNYEYSLKLSELSDLKEKQMKDLFLKKNGNVKKIQKKYIKYIFSEVDIGKILKEEKKNKNNKKKCHKNPTSISISTKLDSNDDSSN